MSSESVAALFARVPEGWSAVHYGGRRWGVSRTRRAGGRVETLYAEELGGTGVVSANLYLPGDSDQEQLRPCEMPATQVIDFLRGWGGVPNQQRDVAPQLSRMNIPVGEHLGAAIARFHERP